MSRHSVLCRDSEALCCVATRLSAHDRDALTRQTSYSGKKKGKKKGPPRFGAPRLPFFLAFIAGFFASFMFFLSLVCFALISEGKTGCFHIRFFS